MRMSYTILLPSVLYHGGQTVGLTCTPPDAFPSLNGSAFKVAAVREPPVNFALPVGLNKTWVDLNLHGNIAQAIEIIQEAKAENVALIAFPELCFPGYPVGINMAYTPRNLEQYVSQSMSVDGPEFQQLRDIWSDGDPAGFVVKITPYGRIGMFECWEHFHPTMYFPMLAQLENIHIAAFPFSADLGVDPTAWKDGEVTGSAAIFVNGGKTANITNATANLSWRYVTTTIDTTQFFNTAFDINGEYSWAALKQIIENYPSYIPKVDSSFFDKKTVNIHNITS
ncbi:hypothetical protein BDV36DRAFT_311818 [Aspergillus pseudocaelatus]|uniref:nitrilase n=1 Tax=Aspergillus pseudocaelatus TaxID=1825620 RepID=A0ABQ6WBE8_9EURO|nr:hypothetical protein BDV36DRAFT_311818 [Aspergillus pseudocaelatus]